jgi:hypothetical protein
VAISIFTEILQYIKCLTIELTNDKGDNMQLQKLGGYVFIEKNEAAIKSLLSEGELGEIFGQVSDPLEREAAIASSIGEIRNILEELQAEPINLSEGELKAIVGSHHIKLREGIYSCLFIGSQLILTLALGATGPGLVWIVPGGSAIIQSVSKARDLIKKLDESELATCEAVFRAIKHKHAQALKVNKASLAEISTIFDTDPNLLRPDELEVVISGLVSKGVLNQSTVGKEVYYELVP